MIGKKLSRRSFLRDTSQLAAGAALAASYSSGPIAAAEPAQADRYNPKKDGGCAVAIGYDVDMPPGGTEYLYDRNLGWQYTEDEIAHGHLIDDIRDYINRLGDTAERYDTHITFFIQGNTFEKQIDIDFWKTFAKRGHALDSHSYNHDGLINITVEEVREQLTKSKKLLETHLGQKNIGLRGPGGYKNGLRGRPELQQAILDVGIRWVSTQFRRATQGKDQTWIDLIPKVQPFYYPTDLLEMPFAGHQDRSYFDVDMGGSPRPVDEWIAYLKGCVDIAYEKNLFLCLTTHPSTSFKHDPKARYLDELFAYCRKRPDIRLCTYREMFAWIDADKSSIE